MKWLINNNICSCGDITLNKGQNTEYKSAAENKISVGTILGFKYAGANQSDVDSAWMHINDLDGEGKEWVSLTLWAEHREQGLFNNVVEPKPKIVQNDTSKQPKDIPTDELW